MSGDDLAAAASKEIICIILIAATIGGFICTAAIFLFGHILFR